MPRSGSLKICPTSILASAHGAPAGPVSGCMSISAVSAFGVSAIPAWTSGDSVRM